MVASERDKLDMVRVTGNCLVTTIALTPFLAVEINCDALIVVVKPPAARPSNYAQETPCIDHFTFQG